MTNARLEELRAKFQENPRRYFAPFANELRKAGDPAQAIAVCRTQLAGQPGHVSGHIVLGQALYEAGQPDEAREVFAAALDLDPENLIALRTLGEIAQVNGDFAGARQWYERLLDADPRNTEVAQLLKDIPAVAPPAPVAAAPAAPVDDPTPFTVRADYEPPAPAAEQSVAAPAPTPAFHTNFTGSQQVYDPDAERKEPEPVLAEQPVDDSDRHSDEPFIDLEPSAHEEQPVMETGHEPVAAASESDPLGMVDFDYMPEEPAGEPQSQAAPDEFLVGASMEPDVTHEDPGEPGVAGEAEFTIDSEERPAAELAGAPESEFAAPEPPSEHSRAVFAERGFDGPTDDERDWMTTPSAAFSDLEAAPETWLDEAESLESEEVPAEPQAEEPSGSTMNAPDYTSDSWFDEVPGASVIESTDVTSSDLWLPPEIPHVTQAEDNTSSLTDVDDETPAFVEAPEEREPEWSLPAPVESASVDEAPAEYESEAVEAVAEERAIAAESVEESQPSWQAPEDSVAEQAEDEPEPLWTARAVEAEQTESIGIDLEALNDAAEDAVVVEHPAESPVVASWSEAEPAATDDNRVEVPAMESEEIFSSDLESTAEMESVAETEAEESSAEAPAALDLVIGHTPTLASDVSASTATPAPFITETLAELYLQQGFRDEALSIYHQLAEGDPANESLKNRIAAIAQRDVPAALTPQVEGRAGSQSVRTFFSRLARRPATGGGESGNLPATGAEPDSNPDVPFASAASALANLFSASKPPAPDEGAASTLAGAYSDPAGRPSRAAERELSLDHLFRDVPAGGSPSGGMTLDEFYSTPDAASGSPTEPGEAGGSEESGGADIRQFTAWLEGLRKK